MAKMIAQWINLALTLLLWSNNPEQRGAAHSVARKGECHNIFILRFFYASRFRLKYLGTRVSTAVHAVCNVAGRVDCPLLRFATLPVKMRQRKKRERERERERKCKREIESGVVGQQKHPCS
jgi:hypothetical protein